MSERLWRDGVRDGLTCDVCSNPYQAGPRDPVTLPCGHTFCRSCLARVEQRLVGLSCPTCRTPHHGRRVALFPPNYAMLSLVDTFSTTVQDEKCLRHKNQLMSYWCRKCETLACGLCIWHSHNKKAHVIVPEAVARGEKRKKLEKQMEDVEKNVEAGIVEAEREAVYQLLQGARRMGALVEVKEALENTTKVLKSAPGMEALLACEERLREMCVSEPFSSEVIHQMPSQNCVCSPRSETGNESHSQNSCVSSACLERGNEESTLNSCEASPRSESGNDISPSSQPSSLSWAGTNNTPQNSTASSNLESRNETPSQNPCASTDAENGYETSSSSYSSPCLESGHENSPQSCSASPSADETPPENSVASYNPVIRNDTAPQSPCVSSSCPLKHRRRQATLADHFPEVKLQRPFTGRMRIHVRCGKELWGRVEGEGGKVLLYTFSCFIPEPSHFSLSWQIMASSLRMEDCLAFLDLSVDGKHLGKVIIRLWTHLRRARHFLGLCLGLWGASFKHTTFHRVQETEFSQFLISQGHHSETTGKTGSEGLMSDLEWDGEFAGPDRVGQVVSFSGGHAHLDAVFGICTMDKKPGGRSRCPFGDVVEGMDVVRKAVANIVGSLVTISSCGLVLSNSSGASCRDEMEES